ncbi:MAG: PEP-CTERM sorting domain-containing protein, partial [Sphingobium sp.]|nr:PEP-CTERM sorting domain-containing protein [Sphingobium sp.]
MSVRMALAKLCACTCGGAIIGGGAVHVAENARPAVVHSSKSMKAAPKKRLAVRTVQRKIVKTVQVTKPQTVT